MASQEAKKRVPKSKVVGKLELREGAPVPPSLIGGNSI
jgi:hypothetical protein